MALLMECCLSLQASTLPFACRKFRSLSRTLFLKFCYGKSKCYIFFQQQLDTQTPIPIIDNGNYYQVLIRLLECK